MSNPFKRFRQQQSSVYDDCFLDAASKEIEPRFISKEEPQKVERKRDIKEIEQNYRQSQHYDRL